MMRLFRGAGTDPLFPAGCVAAIGAFDGVHRGHRQLLADAGAAARERDVPLVALSFEPLPREYFAHADPPARLTPARMKYELLREAGADAVGLLRFNAVMAAMPPEQFVADVLVDALRARRVCVGEDFRFGRARAGDVGLLQQMGRTAGFDVQLAREVCDADGQRVGASAIRRALAAGEFDRAAAALGRRYAIAGRVGRGRQLGRQLGYPTANIPVRWRPAVTGILAVRVTGAGLRDWPGVASLGTRPTVGGGGPAVLEAHLFDFDGDLYGQRLSVEFVGHLRDEAKFDSLDALVERMHIDARLAREQLAAHAADVT